MKKTFSTISLYLKTIGELIFNLKLISNNWFRNKPWFYNFNNKFKVNKNFRLILLSKKFILLKLFFYTSSTCLNFIFCSFFFIQRHKTYILCFNLNLRDPLRVYPQRLRLLKTIIFLPVSCRAKGSRYYNKPLRHYWR